MLKIKKFKILFLFVLIATVVSGCSLFGTNQPAVKAERITLNFWGVFDTPEAYSEIINQYTTAHPNITIVYKKFRWEEYEAELLNAWAEDRGPDIFMLHNDWAGKYETKLLPMPAKTTVGILIEKKGAFKNTTETILDSRVSPSPDEIKDLFAPAVYGDVVRGEKIWGLPIALDSLILFYNRALFNFSGIISAPKTWTELSGDLSDGGMAKKITRTQPDADNNEILARSAIAIGTANNNNRVSDIVSLLMMQQGEILVDKNGKPSYNSNAVKNNQSALGYYLSFSDRTKQNYSWNDSFAKEATDAFVQGKLAMMFGYIYQYPYLRAQAPSLDIGISGVLHQKSDGSDYYEGQSINLANYWILGVAKKTKYSDAAWDFIRFATMDSYKDAKGEIKYRAESYFLNNSGVTDKLRTPALRALILKYKDKKEFQPAISQVLTAQSWYRGKTPEAIEAKIKQFINDVLYNNKNIREAGNFAGQLVGGY
jgi:ABC-type glycerol-3-phosphate transport system substrate-binding protein